MGNVDYTMTPKVLEKGMQNVHPILYCFFISKTFTLFFHNDTTNFKEKQKARLAIGYLTASLKCSRSNICAATSLQLPKTSK